MNGLIGDLVLLSQCTRSVVASGLLGNSTFVPDGRAQFQRKCPGRHLPDPYGPGDTSAVLPAYAVCDQHLQLGSLSEHGDGATGGGVAGGNEIMSGRE